MRAVLLLPLVALALISTAAAQEQSPLKCQDCWAVERVKIPACKNLSKEDMDRLGKLSDADVAKISDDHELAPIKACLCKLSSEAPTILQTCENDCPPEMAKGLQAEASIVAKGVCYVPEPKLQSDENTTDNSTSAEGEDGAGSAGSSASSDPEKPNSEGGNDANKPSTAGASSVQWSGALLTVVAAMVSAVAF